MIRGVIWLVLAVSALLAATATQASARTRCCFLIDASSTVGQTNKYNTEQIKGEDRWHATWRLIAIVRYREQGGFADLVRAAPAHSAAVLSTKSNVMEYFLEPSPVAEPGSCGLTTKKRAVRSPSVSLFRGKLDLASADSFEDRDCIYGHSTTNMEFGSPTGKHYRPWALRLPAPPRSYFRSGRRAIERGLNIDPAAHAPQPNNEHSTDAYVFGRAKIRWFPRKRLSKEVKALRRYHERYHFDDLCNYFAPPECQT